MRMSQPIRVEISQLLNRVQRGQSAEDLMTEFNIPSRRVLQSALMRVMQHTGEDIQIPGLIGRASVDAEYTRGNRVDPAMLESTQMPEGPSNLDKVAQETVEEGYEIHISEGVLTIEPSE